MIVSVDSYNTFLFIACDNELMVLVCLPLINKWTTHKYKMCIEYLILENDPHCLLTYFTDDGGESQEGNVYQYFRVNEAPKWGTCTILPARGRELDTFFTTNCQEWEDEVRYDSLFLVLAKNQNKRVTKRKTIFSDNIKQIHALLSGFLAISPILFIY